jgi:hypothetical protein
MDIVNIVLIIIALAVVVGLITVDVIIPEIRRRKRDAARKARWTAEAEKLKATQRDQRKWRDNQ